MSNPFGSLGKRRMFAYWCPRVILRLTYTREPLAVLTVRRVGPLNRLVWPAYSDGAYKREDLSGLDRSEPWHFPVADPEAEALVREGRAGPDGGVHGVLSQ